MDYLVFLQGLREGAPEFLNLFLFYVTEFMASAIPVLIGLVIFWCVNKKCGYLIMSCYIACSAINQIVKNIACVYRPWILDARIHPHEAALPGATGYSFPSGHTAIATGFFGGLIIWFKENKKLVVLFAFMIALVGFTRNWLGCHTPQDVVCSFLLAVVSIAATNWVLNKVEESPNYDLIASAVFFVASIAFTAYCSLKSYPLDYDAMGALLVDPEEMKIDCYRAFGTLFGISIAWPLERHCVKFSVDGTAKTRVIRMLVGVILVGSVLALGKYAFPLVMPVGAGKFLEYALMVLVAVAAYPALFTWWEHRNHDK